MHATILNQMGIGHTKLTYRFQGRDFRLADVAGNVVKGLMTWRAKGVCARVFQPVLQDR